MRLSLHIDTAIVTLVGSVFLLLGVPEAKTHDLPEYNTRQHGLPYQKRASGGNPNPSGPAWHEHPMWQHPALYEGAKLWPSSSPESSSKSSSQSSSTHSSGHSVEITGSKPSDEVTSHLDKGKAVASGSRAPASAGAGAGPAVLMPGQSALGGSFRKAFFPARMGRPVGTKDSKPRAPYKPRTGRDPSTYKGGRPLGSKNKKPRKGPSTRGPPQMQDGSST
ncbi:unnamed protein product [Sympodiomycopsis kandeliae]